MAKMNIALGWNRGGGKPAHIEAKSVDELAGETYWTVQRDGCGWADGMNALLILIFPKGVNW